MTTLKAQIEELKAGRTLAQLKAEDKKAYYKVKSLTEKLSIEKAKENGQFITKAHLVEYRNLIIWMMAKKGNYNGYLNLKEAMGQMLTRIENKEFIYKTEKGIKSILCNLALSIALENCEANVRTRFGLDELAGSQDSNALYQFEQFKLRTLSC